VANETLISTMRAGVPEWQEWSNNVVADNAGAICYTAGHSKLRNARGEEAEALHIAHVIHRHTAPLTSGIFFV
jgi:hypothetical protein